jgi:DNA-binding NtrC family response regulator
MRTSSILLVDDDALILQAIGSNLKSRGYEIATADSGKAAIDMLEKGNYDLVMTDLIMYGINGIEVLNAVKAKDPDIVVLILTGYGDMQSAIDAFRQGADDYILKPCNPEELAYKVRHHLEKEELARKVKVFERILPVCCVCKKIRDDTGVEPGAGKWFQLEDYLHNKAKIDVTSGLCPDCFVRMDNEFEVS